MVSIPTPIPEHLASMGAWLRDGPWLLRLWRVVVFVVLGLAVVAALSSGTVLVAAVAGIVVSIVLADDIKQTLRDIWNLDFWVFKP